MDRKSKDILISIVGILILGFALALYFLLPSQYQEKNTASIIRVLTDKSEYMPVAI